jgi:parallel beta-helix repeat protein
VRVEWTNGPDENNGAYGLYPVQSSNVLIEESVVIGASDAGIYVGQSNNIIVRNSRVEFNVAGIEIENSTYTYEMFDITTLVDTSIKYCYNEKNDLSYIIFSREDEDKVIKINTIDTNMSVGSFEIPKDYNISEE